MGFAAIIIGDEIIRGKRQDGHFTKIRQLLSDRGLMLDIVTYVGDNPKRLTRTLRQSLKTDDVVFCFGGIGITPDDRTRQCAAEAADVPLEVHPEAEREIRALLNKLKRKVTEEALQFGAFPRGSRVVPNPVNRLPGFSFRDHHFVPGFPQMAWPMVEWVLETHYRDRFHCKPEAEKSIFVLEGNEGILLPLMKRLEKKYPSLQVFSLPTFGNGIKPMQLEIGVRGDPEQLEYAFTEICNDVSKLGLEYRGNCFDGESPF